MENPNVEIVYHAYESLELASLIVKLEAGFDSGTNELTSEGHKTLGVLLNFLKFAA